MTESNDLLTACIRAPKGSLGHVLFSGAIQSVFGGEEGEKRSKEMIDDWWKGQPRVFTRKSADVTK